MTTAPLVVEFCGLPGTGKTTLAAQTCRALESAGVTARIADQPVSAAAPRWVRVRRRGLLALTTVATRPAEAARSARLVADSDPTPRDGIALLAQLLAVHRLASAARHREGVSLVEEGLVQTMWSLALRGSTDVVEPMRRRLAAGSGADLVVLVDAPVDQLLHRLEVRQSRHSRTQRLDADARRAELQHGRGLLDQLLSDLPHEVLTIRNDGSRPLVELGQQAAGWVLRAV